VTLTLISQACPHRIRIAVRRLPDSGYGYELFSTGIQEFVNKKLVRVASIDAPA
jgi:hypothetical protein